MVLRRWLSIFFAFAALCSPRVAHAGELRISAKALERTLEKQLFNGPEGRYYMRGDAHAACFVYAEHPVVSFKDDRIVIHVKTRARIGTSIKAACLGIGLAPEADVSVLPEAEGETIGFRDARVEHLSESKELNFFLEPFLSHKLPQRMKINAADLLRQTLTRSTESTGYDIRLDALRIHSMHIIGQSLVVDFDGEVSVN